jgi:hypothetical protein
LCQKFLDHFCGLDSEIEQSNAQMIVEEAEINARALLMF